MSSDPPIDGRSPAADERAGAPANPAAGATGLDPADSDRERAAATVVRIRGLPLLDALEQRAAGFRDHADAVATYAFAIAVELGLTRTRSELIREVARLHDVGRLYVPAPVAVKPRDELEASELEAIEQSPDAGAELARGAGIPEEVCQWLLATRERYDGHGQCGLGGEQIPLPARITRAACAYQEVTERAGQRPMQPGESRALAISELSPASGTVLDPSVLDALARVVARASVATR